MSFIGVWYDPKFSVTAEELNYLSACVCTLLDRTQSLYTDNLRRSKDTV